MAKTDNLKISILLDGKSIYFGAPVFYSKIEKGGELTLIVQTEIGMQTKQKLEIQIKNPTYVEPIIESGSGDIPREADTSGH
jgi:hypothetical protein